MSTTRALCTLALLAASAAAWAAPRGLVLIERESDRDRALLSRQELPLVAELSPALVAHGDVEAITAAARSLGYAARVLETDTSGRSYGLVGLLPGWTREDLAACGEPLWSRQNLVLTRTRGEPGTGCTASPHLMWSSLTLEGLLPPVEPSPQQAGDSTDQASPLSLVQEMVDRVSEDLVLSHWRDVVEVAASRYSTDPGCQQAAELVFDKFLSLELETAYQEHFPAHAPNIVARLEGAVHPEDVSIVIGHLDDMPATGPAPGANDNASGAAGVTVAAEVLSDYAFEGSVVFIAFTGEETGYLGSTHYANDAYARGEGIRAVLNADMIAWEGDGAPASEDLDLNYDAGSAWLGDLFAELAADYGTGCPVNAFLCPSKRNSDHYAFWANGWSAVDGITDNQDYCGRPGNYPWYHTADDTMARCGDPGFYVSAVKAYLATLAHLARPLCRRPEPPSELSAEPSGVNTIALGWQPAAGKVHYEIQRASGSCGTSQAWSVMGETTATNFVDFTASGGHTYAYRVRARDKTGYCLSRAGDCVEATAGGACLEPPRFAGLGSLSDEHEPGCGLALSWSEATPVCGGSVRYNVYRSTDPDFVPGPANLVASCISGMDWTDSAVDPFVATSYVVRAEDDAPGGGGPCGGNEDSNQIRLRATATGPPVELFLEDFESGLVRWESEDPWQLATGTAHAGTHSAFGGSELETCASLTLRDAVALPADARSSLTLWTDYALWHGYDGVQLQISSDDGASWELLAPDAGYPGATRALCGQRIDATVFTGTTAGWRLWEFDLSAWAGEQVKLRLVMVSHRRASLGGFYVDDISIQADSTCGVSLDEPVATALDSCPEGGPGDGDAVLDAGEDIRLEVAVTNVGRQPASGITLSLASSTPGVTVTRGVASLPDAAPGATSSSEPPHLGLRIGPEVACGSELELELGFSATEGSWTRHLTRTLGQPVAGPTAVLSEDFESGLPTGWRVEDGFEDGHTWFADDASDPAGCQNLDPDPPLAGGWAAVDSDCAGQRAMDETLVTPPLDLREASSVSLTFDHFLATASAEQACVDVRSSLTGGVWISAERWAGASVPSRQEHLDVTRLAAGAADVEIRWRYRRAEFDLYWFIDNVVVSISRASDCRMSLCPGIPVEVRPVFIAKNSTCSSGTCISFPEQSEAQGYHVYEGTIGAWFSHGSAPGNACQVEVTSAGAGRLRAELSSSSGGRYYLVTAFGPRAEGTTGNTAADAQASCPP